MHEPETAASHDPVPPAGTTGRPLIGVIGGLGPAATVDFYAKVVAATTADSDQQHVRLLVDGDPVVPDRSRAIAGSGESSGPALAAKAKRLAVAGAEVLVMPCNSAHAFEDEIRAAVDLPFVSIVQEAVRDALERLPAADTAGTDTAGADTAGADTAGVGILATSGTHAAGVYRTALSRHDARLIEPTAAETDEFMTLLQRIKGGDTGASVRSAMAALAAHLVERGAAVIIAGCTEAPLVLDESSLAAELRARGLPPAGFIDSTAALAKAVVALGSDPLHPYSSQETVRAKL